MTGWVEASLVEDVNGRTFDHGSGGVIGNGNPGDATETARGWVGGVGGNSRAVAGADLPKRIYVRWQSAVEPQTYRAWIDIGEEARQIMYDSTHRRCEETPERTARYMAALYLGLAPGGVVQAITIHNLRHLNDTSKSSAYPTAVGERSHSRCGDITRVTPR